jgi:hypothetical protein
LARPLDRARLAALGFGVVLLHKDRRAGVPLPPGERSLLGPGLSRMGEMPPARFAAARRRLEAACGPPLYEDERVAAFRLAPGAGP